MKGNKHKHAYREDKFARLKTLEAMGLEDIYVGSWFL